ncbi:hypothetical protein [uncultured Corynebacterium sp.]|uniref:hypothetical protein n=1 Tax=uncultured Corynebacterium sp. TaxID=159447 RepID=UPI0025F7DCC1|nr:hypothetical protein [uncultured Corynebacterium sp.]
MSRIENEAEMLFRSIFHETRKIEPAFTVGEKGAITDGHVDIYNSGYNQQTDHSLRDGSYIGRLPVQIRGKLTHKNRRLKSFKVQRSELESIKKIGGLVLLVATIDRKSHVATDPYFADLTGANTQHFLEQMTKTQDSKMVPVKPFPVDPEQVFEYVTHLNRRYRSGLPTKPNDTIMENLDQIKVTLPYEFDLSKPQLFGGPGSSALLESIDHSQETRFIDAILQVTPASYTLSTLTNLSISCGGVEFVSCRRRRTNASTFEFYISPGIRLTFGPEGQKEARLRFQTSLYDSIKDQRFLAGVSKGDWILANGERWLLLDHPNKAIEEFTKPLPYLEDVERLCETFGVDPRLFKVGDLPHEQLESIKRVVLCLFYDAEFKNAQGIPLRQSLKVNGDVIELLWIFEEGNEKWVPVSFFDSSKFWCRAPLNDSEISDGEPVQELVTPFEFFSAEELTRVLNLNPELLVNSYRRIESHRAREFARATLSKLIRAADLRENRRREFLTMALELCRWLRKDSPSDCLLFLDEMQIKKRLGDLTTEDLQSLNQLWKDAGQRTSDEDALQIEAASSILLGKPGGAEYLLGKMEEQARATFESQPISFLRAQASYEIGMPNNQSEWGKVENEINQENYKRIAHLYNGKSVDLEHH